MALLTCSQCGRLVREAVCPFCQGAASQAREPGKREASRFSVRDILMVLLLAAGLTLIFIVPRACSIPMEGENLPAKDFDLPFLLNPLEGQSSFHLAEQKGHVVVLAFWASWCPPCRAEAPVLDALSKEYAARGVRIIGVDSDDGEGAARRFAAKLSYPIVRDPTNQVPHNYKIRNLPTLFVIDKEGVVRAIREGGQSESTIRKLIDAQLR